MYVYRYVYIYIYIYIYGERESVRATSWVPCLLARAIGTFFAEQQAPAPHLTHPEGCFALRIVLATVPRVSSSCEHFRMGSISTSYACQQQIDSSYTELVPSFCNLEPMRQKSYRVAPTVQKCESNAHSIRLFRH